MNRLRFQWNTAVSTAASCTTWHQTNFTSHSTPRTFVPAPTVAYTCTHKSMPWKHTHAHSPFFSFSFFLSLTAFLSFCLCFISQLGECLNVIITFAIKSKQQGWIEECMPDLPFSTPRVPQHVECYFDCCWGGSLLLLSTNGAAFF